MFSADYRRAGIPVLLFLLLNILAGCGRLFVKPAEYEARQKEKKIKTLLEKREKISGRLKIINEKLNNAAGRILIFNARQIRGRKLNAEEIKLNNEYMKEVSAAENETKNLNKEFGTLESELEKTEYELKCLGIP